MNSLFQIDIPRRSLTCSKGGERLMGGMEYYSLLSQDENQKFVRHDFCLACWEQFFHENQLNQREGYWKSRVDIKVEASSSQPYSKLEKAMILLKKLTQENNRNEAEIFVLALFLARARRLLLRSEIQQDDGMYLLYEAPSQEEFFTVKRLDLSQIAIASLQKSLANQLNTDK